MLLYLQTVNLLHKALEHLLSSYSYLSPHLTRELELHHSQWTLGMTMEAIILTSFHKIYCVHVINIYTVAIENPDSIYLSFIVNFGYNIDMHQPLYVL